MMLVNDVQLSGTTRLQSKGESLVARHKDKMKKHTDSSELGSNVQNHNHGHPQRDDVEEAGSPFEDDCIGQLNVPRITIWYDARGARY